MTKIKDLPPENVFPHKP